MLQNSQAWLDVHSGGIQAICAVLGVVGLSVYTFLTYGIRRASIRQALGAQRPLLVFDNSNEERDWRLLNKGSGPALQVHWKVGTSNHRGEWHAIGAIAVGDWSDLATSQSASLSAIPEVGLRVHYEDLSGNSFCTTVHDVGHTVLQDCSDMARRHRFDLF